MDFHKIENIFIIAFCLINLFLIMIIFSAHTKFQDVTEKELTLEEKLTKYHINTNNLDDQQKKAFYLSAQSVNLITQTNHSDFDFSSVEKNKLDSNGFKIIRDLGTQDLTSNKHELNKNIEHLLNDQKLIFQGDKYHYYLNDISNENNDELKLIFSQKYQELPINDESSQVSFIINKKSNNYYQVIESTQSLVENFERLSEKDNLISEKNMVQNLLELNHLPPKSRIMSSKLTYHCILRIGQKNIYVPVWSVKIKKSNGNIVEETVNAFNNKIITNQKTIVVEDDHE